MSLILLKILLQVPVDGRTKIFWRTLFILPVVIFAVIGVQGERLTAYLFHILCFLKNRRVLTTPSGRYQLERKRRIERREHKRRKKGGDNHQSGNKGTGRTVKRGKKGRKRQQKEKKILESEQKKAERRQLLEEERIRKQQKKEEHQLQKQLNQAEYPGKPVRENTQSEIRRKKKSEELEENRIFFQLHGHPLIFRLRK